ncbi:hypothetical protein I7I50_03065 [Histoplasma capsulatum G186AR]|uniref:Uncharacterized protein n=1 Tax=Ajellomyces capsulatus TaxID=5037 RepID=A0A8H8D6F9_AJECA|nr:hypothetical protein I7I52_00270 [Histoplasma capsulatum]QSS72019.1 hypothetical protein I7I50_03065 [Histoplasma capsulatum G186AR]
MREGVWVFLLRNCATNWHHRMDYQIPRDSEIRRSLLVKYAGCCGVQHCSWLNIYIKCEIGGGVGGGLVLITSLSRGSLYLTK